MEKSMEPARIRAREGFFIRMAFPNQATIIDAAFIRLIIYLGRKHLRVP